jgi:hypothetical protein
MWAAFRGRTATITELVRLGADVNAKDEVRLGVAKGACICCSCACRCVAARTFVDSAYPCEELNCSALQRGWTALLIVGSRGDVDATMLLTAAELVRLGAHINASDTVRIPRPGSCMCEPRGACVTVRTRDRAC